MFTYCSAITSMVPLAEIKEKKKKGTGGNVDNNWYILLSTFHLSSLQTQQKKMLLGRFTILRQKEDNYNTNFLNSQHCKKLLITFIIEFNCPFQLPEERDDQDNVSQREFLALDSAQTSIKMQY